MSLIIYSTLIITIYFLEGALARHQFDDCSIPAGMLDDALGELDCELANETLVFRDKRFRFRAVAPVSRFRRATRLCATEQHAGRQRLRHYQALVTFSPWAAVPRRWRCGSSASPPRAL